MNTSIERRSQKIAILWSCTVMPNQLFVQPTPPVCREKHLAFASVYLEEALGVTFKFISLPPQRVVLEADAHLTMQRAEGSCRVAGLRNASGHMAGKNQQ